MNHWFDGYAIIYKFDILGEKQVKFHKKFLQSGVYQRALAAGKPVVTEFGTRAFPEPKKGFFARLLANVVRSIVSKMILNSYICNLKFITVA